MLLCLVCLFDLAYFFLSSFSSLICIYFIIICGITLDILELEDMGHSTALGVLCCFALFVCLTLLASFFLPSHLSFSIYFIIICGITLDILELEDMGHSVSGQGWGGHQKRRRQQQTVSQSKILKYYYIHHGHKL